MRHVVLTFDNGPTPGVTDHVLDVLAAHETRATFFVVGERVREPHGSDLVARSAGDGHWIGNHSMTHGTPLGIRGGAATVHAEIAATQVLLGDHAHPDLLFRPWGTAGALDTRCLSPQAVDHLVFHGYTCVLWDSVPRDWADPTGWVDTAISQVLDRPTDEPAVVVLHDLPTGAMERLDEFLNRLADLDVVVVQELPTHVLPIRRGAVLDERLLDDLTAPAGIVRSTV